MTKHLLEACFKCKSRDAVEFLLVSTNKAGGEVYKIKCNNCGLSSVEESLQDRLVRWWNEREFKMPPDNMFSILKAIEMMDKTLEKSGKVNKGQLIESLEIIKEQLGINIMGGKEE